MLHFGPFTSPLVRREKNKLNGINAHSVFVRECTATPQYSEHRTRAMRIVRICEQNEHNSCCFLSHVGNKWKLWIILALEWCAVHGLAVWRAYMSLHPTYLPLNYSHGTSGTRRTHTSARALLILGPAEWGCWYLRFEQRCAYANFEFDIPKIHWAELCECGGPCVCARMHQC